MELLLIQIVAAMRPLASIKYVENFFDVLGVGLSGLMIGAVLMRSAVHGTLKIGPIDLLIVGFSIWCCAIYLVYFESAQLRYVLKIVIPLLAYVAVKNVLRDVADYRRLLLWIIVAFVIPVLLSAILIMTGKGAERVNYWTGLTRWSGAYLDSHSLGHSMTLLLMTIGIYVRLRPHEGHGVLSGHTFENLFLAGLSIVALYCLYMSQVRSAILGLLVFATVYLFFFNRKLLFFGAAGLTALAVATLPFWLPALVPEIAGKNANAEVNVMELGSGRPTYWTHDFLLYLDLPLDHKLAGVGIGMGDPAPDNVVKYTLYGHNDWLDVLTQTGLVGFLLFVAIKFLMFKNILRLPREQKRMFLALFIAVVAMMFVSNSYAWRIQVSQLYFMVLAFIEVARRTEALASSPQPELQAQQMPVTPVKRVEPVGVRWRPGWPRPR